MKNKLLIATHNKAKLEYFSKLLTSFDLELLSLNDFKISSVVEENGLDETENALIKARYYAKLSGVASFADDAGMYIPALGNMPGVQVRRWAGRFSDEIGDREWLDFFLDQMKQVNDKDRKGYFKISRAIVTSDGSEHVMRWSREFKVLDTPNWSLYKEGWPMSAVTIDTALGKSFMDLSEEEKLMYEGDNLLEFDQIFKKIYK
ncbi:MAG: non-canonical purine NTP pyrophosphatase [bacterium]